MNREKFLPIGTVVLLKGATKRLMITGFCITSEDQSIYDYSGCLYPEGIISSNQTALFNHEQIVEISYMGLEDDEDKDFKIKLNKVLAEVIKYEEEIEIVE